MRGIMKEHELCILRAQENTLDAEQGVTSNSLFLWICQLHLLPLPLSLNIMSHLLVVSLLVLSLTSLHVVGG